MSIMLTQPEEPKSPGAAKAVLGFAGPGFMVLPRGFAEMSGQVGSFELVALAVELVGLNGCGGRGALMQARLRMPSQQKPTPSFGMEVCARF